LPLVKPNYAANVSLQCIMYCFLNYAHTGLGSGRKITVIIQVLDFLVNLLIISIVCLLCFSTSSCK